MRTTTATFFLSLFGLILLLTSCGQKREPINIGGNTWLGYQPYYLAKEEFGCSACPTHDSYVGGQAFRINMMPATTSTLRLFGTGELDGALLTLDEAIGFQSRTQIPICVAQILSYSDGADAILAMPDFDPDHPFVIGNEQSALGGFKTARGIEALKWIDKPFEQRVVHPASHVDALLSGEVNVVVTYEPYVSKLVERGAMVLFSSRDMPGEILDVLVVRQDIARRHEDSLIWLGSSFWYHGLSMMKEREESLKFIAARTGADLTDLQTALSGIHFPSWREAQAFAEQDYARILGVLNHYLLSYQHLTVPGNIPLCENIIYADPALAISFYD